MKLLYQSSLIILACIIVFAKDYLPYSDLIFLTLGLTLGAYFAFLHFKKKHVPESLAIFSVITLALVLIFATGKFSSPLFFMLYFLTFGIVFIFEPLTVFVFVASVIAILLPDIVSNAVLEHIIKASSIVIISPIAFFFGREHRRDIHETKLKIE